MARAVASMWRSGLCALTMVLAPVAAHGQTASMTGLSDQVFGTVSFTADQTLSQSVCAFSGALLRGYSVTAYGSGTGGAFTIQSGASQLPYDVQWSATAGAASGSALTANTALTGLTANVVLSGCPLGLARSGTLIVILRSAAVVAATAGDYSGTLSLLMAPN